MKINLDDVAFWMDAIRNSHDRDRTLESFWKGQLKSKVWLIDRLTQHLHSTQSLSTVAIYGGWNGVLASLIFNTDLEVSHITSIDIDPTCEETAKTINKRYEIEGRFTALTGDMCDHHVKTDITINTSCEHISQDQYNKWLDGISTDSLIILQSNNYVIPEHVRISNSLEEFAQQSHLSIIDQCELELPLYTRYMLVGRKL